MCTLVGEVWVHMCQGVMCRGQGTILGSHFSPPTLWVPGIKIKLRRSCLMANTFADPRSCLTGPVCLFLEGSWALSTYLRMCWCWKPALSVLLKACSSQHGSTLESPRGLELRLSGRALCPGCLSPIPHSQHHGARGSLKSLLR